MTETNNTPTPPPTESDKWTLTIRTPQGEYTSPPTPPPTDLSFVDKDGFKKADETLKYEELRPEWELRIAEQMKRAVLDQDYGYIVDFIRTLLAEQKARMVEEVEGMKRDLVKAFSAKGREGDIALLEGIAYNQALEAVATKLQGLYQPK